MLDVLHYVGLPERELETEISLQGKELAYMFYPLHDLHFVFDFLVQDAVLHELALVKLLRGIGLASEPPGDLIYGGESTSAYLAHAIVLV
jgi:hypothetical protein